MFLRGLLYLRPVTNCGRHVGFRSCVEPDSHRKSYSMVGRPSQTAYITADSLAEHVLVKPIALFPNWSRNYYINWSLFDCLGKYKRNRLCATGTALSYCRSPTKSNVYSSTSSLFGLFGLFVIIPCLGSKPCACMMSESEDDGFDPHVHMIPTVSTPPLTLDEGKVVRETDMQSDAVLDQYILDTIRSVTRSELVMPYEFSHMGSHTSFMSPMVSHHCTPVLMPHFATVPLTVPAQQTLREQTGTMLSVAVKRLHIVPWPEQQIGNRHRALQKWRMILEEDFNSTSLGAQLYEQVLCQAPDSALQATIEDSFAKKATSTLNKRGSAFLGYLVWHRRNYGSSGMPLVEKRVYSYVTHLRSQQAASAAGSFLSSVNFMLHLLALRGADTVIESARIQGAVHNTKLTRKVMKQRRPLLVDEVRSLEAQASLSKCPFDRYACLFFLCCLYSRARYNDMCSASEVEADLDEAGVGFIEARTLNAKTQKSAEQKRTFLPLVGPADGLTKLHWGIEFMAERKRQKIDTFRWLLPTPSVKGVWVDSPTDVGTAAKWLRDLLAQSGHTNLSETGTHSLKTTVLSWAAKWGTPLEIRSLMGYHIGREVTSAVTYSRDAQATPLREIINIIAAIRNNEFHPDLTRSGRITVKKPRVSTVETDEPGFELVSPHEEEEGVSSDGYVVVEQQVPPATVPYRYPDEAIDRLLPPVPSSADSSSSSDSGGSSSEESIPDGEAEILAKVRPLLTASREDHSVYAHRLSAVLHLKGDEHTRFKCNRHVSCSYSKVAWDQAGKYLNCMQCFAPTR